MEETLMAGETNPFWDLSSPRMAAAPPGTCAARTERRARPPPRKEKALDCPRCSSADTRFCYYSNYSLRQPRYFCNTCRRYWTEDGPLGGVRVGSGESRKKNRRSPAAAAVPSGGRSSTARARRPWRSGEYAAVCSSRVK